MVYAFLAQVLQGDGGVALETEVLEEALYLEVPADPLVLYQRVWIHRVLCKFIVIVLNEAGIQGESADHLILQ